MGTNRWLPATTLSFAVTVGLAAAALAQTPEPDHKTAKSEQGGEHDTGAMLERVRESLDARDTAKAGERMREAAASLRADASTAPKHVRTRMTESAKKLERTADKVSAGKTLDEHEVDITLAAAAHALAGYHHAQASDALRSNDRGRLGRHMEAAAHDLGRAAKWTGAETERGVRDIVGGTAEVAGRVTEGVGAIPKEVGRAVEGLGRGIDRVGNVIYEKRATKAPKQ